MTPCRRLGLSNTDFLLLKAIVLLAPDVSGLSLSSRDRLEEMRSSFMRALYQHCAAMSNHSFSAAMRLSALLMVLPSLTLLASQIVSDLTLAQVFGLATVISNSMNLTMEPAAPSVSQPSNNGILADISSTSLHVMDNGKVNWLQSLVAELYSARLGKLDLIAQENFRSFNFRSFNFLNSFNVLQTFLSFSATI